MENTRTSILKGTSASPGRASGMVKIVKELGDLDKITDQDIMVVGENNPIYATGLMQCKGLICEKGGLLSHICIVAGELGIPCLVDANGALEKLSDNDHIVLDASEGTVYFG